MKFKGLFNHFREMKHYFIAAALVFGFGFVIGWQRPDQLAQFLNSQIKSIQNIGETLNAKSHPQLWLFIFIFLNNASKAILFIFLGLLFGIMPLVMLVVNGMVLGYILSHQASESTWLLVAKGILPHGIIEIPAIVITCAYGIKLGALAGKMILHLFIPAFGKSARSEMGRVVKLTVPLMVFLVVVLLGAAVIESTITFWLMGN